MAMPLLAGQRAYPINDVLTALLKHATRWLSFAAHMGTVRLYLMDDDHLRAWSSAMDSILGRRELSEAQSAATNGLTEEVLGLVSHPDTAISRSGRETFEYVRKRLILEPMALGSIASSGRRLAEHVVNEVCKRTGVPCPHNLAKDIARLRRLEMFAPWFASYLDSLRVFGNEEAHTSPAAKYRPEALQDEDLAALLACMLRVIRLLQDWPEG